MIDKLLQYCQLLALILLLAGCGSLGNRFQDAGDGPSLADVSLAVTASDSIPLDQPGGLAESQIPKVMPEEPPVTSFEDCRSCDLDSVFQHALQLASFGNWNHAQVCLFSLEEGIRHRLAGSDSLSVLQARGMRRRVALLRALHAEQAAAKMPDDGGDLILARGYRDLEGSLPDSLIPATGEPIPGIMADLLRWENPRVDHWLQYFTERGRRTFELWLQRKAEVEDVMVPLLEQEGVPDAMIYLAMIESGFAATARSDAAAVGPWQFMAPTARAWDLRVDWWVDERQDYAASTRAAARYLNSLHDIFGDWSLVLAAYNAGQNRILNKIRLRATDNYWDLNLPAQTADFVPKFIAAARIGEDPERYGFTQPLPETRLAFGTITVRHPTGLDLVAKCAGVAPGEIRLLNPGLLRAATPPDAKAYPVHVPPGTEKQTIAALTRVPADKRLTWSRHRVQRGETLSGIASRYGCAVADIARVNHLRDTRLIHPGDQLVIPMPEDLDRLSRRRAVEKGHYVPPAGYARVSYRVRSGDTLSGIARKLGVTLTHLRKVNNIHRTSLIHPGDRLYAYRPSS